VLAPVGILKQATTELLAGTDSNETRWRYTAAARGASGIALGAGAATVVAAGSTESLVVMLADWTIPGALLASIGAVLGPALSG